MYVSYHSDTQNLKMNNVNTEYSGQIQLGIFMILSDN